jgi:hypothetical protein
LVTDHAGRWWHRAAIAGRAQTKSIAFTVGSVALLIALLYTWFTPRWETNDDVAMSMVAHGYGLAAYGSPHLVFSNVVWGLLVRAVPPIADVTGYAIATIACLILAGGSILCFLVRLGAPITLVCLCGILSLARPIFFPQFTINAGLLTVAAILGLHAYVRHKEVGILAVSCGLAFLAYLVREQEFLLVLLIAVPMLPWQAIYSDRRIWVGFLFLGAAIIIAFVIDRFSYSAPDWTAFLELNLVRAQFTDFGIGRRLFDRPDILARHGFSENDVRLIGSWFLVDPEIANPAKLKAILAEVGLVSLQYINLRMGLAALQALVVPPLLPLVLPAIILLALRPHRCVMWSWALCLIVLFVIGMFGRPGILRVYVPLVTLLMVAPLAFTASVRGIKQAVGSAVIIVASLAAVVAVIEESTASERRIRQVRREMRLLPETVVVTWGSHFPFEYAFPLLSEIPRPQRLQLYPLGVFTLAPFSIAASERTAGRGMLERLKSAEGVPVIAGVDKIELMRRYCRERMNGELRELAILGEGELIVRYLRCVVQP